MTQTETARATAGRRAVGHPIDVSTGAMFIDATDVSFSGRIAMAFRRHYNTAWVGERAGILGRGWRCGFDFELTETLEGFRYKTPQGNVFQFLLEPGAERARLPGDGLELRRVGPDEVRIIGYGRARVEPEMVFRRADSGRTWPLHEVRRGALARLEFVRRDGRILLVRQTRERKALRFDYDQAGRLSTISFATFDGHPLRQEVRYHYGPTSDLLGVEDVRGIALRFEYDAQGYMRSETRRSGMVYEFTYDAQGRCVQAGGREGYHARWLKYETRKTLVTNSHGAVETYTLNDRGQVQSFESATGLRLLYKYDDLGRLVEQTLPNGGKYSHVYDQLGRRIADELPNGDKFEYEFDAEHRLTAVQDWMNRRVELLRDADGRLISASMLGRLSWTYAYTEYGEIAEIGFPDGTRRGFAYDGVGNLAVMTDRRGHTWQFQYDALGNVTSTVDPLSNAAQYEYDAGGALTRFIGRDGRVLSYNRSDDGRTLRETRADGSYRAIHYNACGMPLEIIDFDRRTTRFEWDTEPGLLRAVIAPDGSRFEMEYNADGFPIRRKTWDGSEYQLEWAGDLLTASIDPLGRRVEFEYDKMGRPVKQTRVDGVVEFAWDDFHQIAKIVSPSGELRFERDELGQLVREFQNDVEMTHEYDVNGRRTAYELEGSRSEFNYLPTGHCNSVAWQGGKVDLGIDPLGREVGRSFAFGGLLQHVYDAEGRTLAARYAQTPGAQPDVQRLYDYDANGVLSRVDDNQRGRTWFVHSPAGALLSAIHETGLARFFGYDSAGGRQWTATVADGGEFIRRYGGFHAGWHESAGASLAAELAGEGSRYAYEKPRRLQRVSSNDKDIEFTFDGAGFVTQKVVRRYGASPEISRYVWNAGGQLSAFIAPNGDEYQYTYDGYGRRIAKRGPSGDARYLWDSTDLVRIEDSKGVIDLVREPRTGQLIGVVENGATRYVLCDHRGAPSELLDGSGSVIRRIDRGPFGERSGPEVVTPPPAGERDETPWGLLGQIYDEESGLYYNTYRYYDPEIGRFISPDPIDVAGGLDPYALSSPLLCTDELGLATQRYPGPYWNSDYFDGNPPTNSTVSDSRVTNAGPGDTRHSGGADISHNGSTDTVPMHNNTMARVYDGDPNNGGQMVYATFNGHEHVGNPDAGRATHGPFNPSTNEHSPVTTGSWWHGEQWAASLGANNAHAVNALRNGTGPVVVDISRPPCARCAPSIEGLAGALANATGREVHVRWPGQTEEEAQAARASPNSGCGS